jgi:phosphinothricin acetyltransferase
MIIRNGSETDLDQVNEIYNWHSENGFSTFLEISTLEQRKEWIRRFEDPERHLFLVAEEDKRIIGVTCSVAYRGGGVFRNTLETSIYLYPNCGGKGLGSQLYASLFQQLQNKGIHRIVVGIALPNDASVALHRKFGFEKVGIFDEYAFYKGAYRSSLWMQKKMDR